MISPHHKKPMYALRNFTEDYAATDWLNEMFDQGYVVVNLRTTVVDGSRDRRKREVQVTILMRLQMDDETPLQAHGTLRTLRDLRLDPDVLALNRGEAA